MTGSYSLSPGGVPLRDPDEILIMRNSVKEHPDSGRMSPKSDDFGISWWGNGYSRRNTWMICDQSSVISLKNAR